MYYMDVVLNLIPISDEDLRKLVQFRSNEFIEEGGYFRLPDFNYPSPGATPEQRAYEDSLRERVKILNPKWMKERGEEEKRLREEKGERKRALQKKYGGYEDPTTYEEREENSRITGRHRQKIEPPEAIETAPISKASEEGVGPQKLRREKKPMAITEAWSEARQGGGSQAYFVEGPRGGYRGVVLLSDIETFLNIHPSLRLKPISG